MWRPGYTITPYKILTVREANPTHLEHFNQQLKLSETFDRTVKESNEKYLRDMEERQSNVRKAGLLQREDRTPILRVS